ncbi:MAG TPA: 2Fe-2S iron-sulfur cluster-binding protein [Actinocrinis sp.]|jgi:2Fe-2S ferredoxin|uniref:2Fe-2S iron-sulfur cluster-binding protein n=1 Tax=Actinocrinis sp. TaxID=1920516 RepID=UPI002D52682A|nr:2Fe-2S iron-sulfur cluster-binding protein [Actinocrinis sp.]HZU56457.1 2Fe-2S iron-sulfur cluster-binding protein [Actinocrinis sp.]
MARITYVQPDGVARTIDVPAGNTVMRGAVINSVDGIVGRCGGGAMCGTCHVYVDEGSTVPLPSMHPVEDELLYDTAAPRKANSRLSCQLPVTDEIDGLVVNLPIKQL